VSQIFVAVTKSSFCVEWSNFLDEIRIPDEDERPSAACRITYVFPDQPLRRQTNPAPDIIDGYTPLTAYYCGAIAMWGEGRGAGAMRRIRHSDHVSSGTLRGRADLPVAVIGTASLPLKWTDYLACLGWDRCPTKMGLLYAARKILTATGPLRRYKQMLREMDIARLYCLEIRFEGMRQIVARHGQFSGTLVVFYAKKGADIKKIIKNHRDII